MQWSGLSGNKSTIIVWMRLQWATHWPPQNQNQDHDSCVEIHRPTMLYTSRFGKPLGLSFCGVTFKPGTSLVPTNNQTTLQGNLNKRLSMSRSNWMPSRSNRGSYRVSLAQGPTVNNCETSTHRGSRSIISVRIQQNFASTSLGLPGDGQSHNRECNTSNNESGP